MDQWTNGPMDQWTDGLMDQWTNGANNRLANLKVTLVLKLAEFDLNGVVDLKLTPGNSLTCWLAPKLATLRYL